MSRIAALPCLLLALLLLVGSGCDDAPEVGPEDLGIVLGASPRSVCPDVGMTGTAEVFLDATVYARDGTAMEGQIVFFESSDESIGTVNPEKGESNFRGLVTSALTTRKTDLITVTARVKGVGEDSADIEAPKAGRLTGFPTPEGLTRLDQAYFENELFDIFMVLGDACHAQEIQFTLTYDPTYVEYQETLVEPTFLPGVTTDVSANGGGGVVDVQLTIDPDDESSADYTGSGGFVRVRFIGLNETPTDPNLILSEFSVITAQVWDRSGEPYRFDPAGQLLAVQILPEPDP